MISNTRMRKKRVGIGAATSVNERKGIGRKGKPGMGGSTNTPNALAMKQKGY